MAIVLREFTLEGVQHQQWLWGMPQDAAGYEATRVWMQYVAYNTRFVCGVQLKFTYEGVDGLLILQTDEAGVQQYNHNEYLRKQQGGVQPVAPDWYFWHAYWYPGLELLSVYDLKNECILVCSFFSCAVIFFLQICV